MDEEEPVSLSDEVYEDVVLDVLAAYELGLIPKSMGEEALFQIALTALPHIKEHFPDADQEETNRLACEFAIRMHDEAKRNVTN